MLLGDTWLTRPSGAIKSRDNPVAVAEISCQLLVRPAD